MVKLERMTMYICVCNALNENSVKEAALKSPSNLSITQVYKEMGVRPQCGMCLCDAQTLVDQTRAEWHKAN
jgi:bacterioferritin-associated ferredoxin